jgi:tRNA A37 threonylcarbamoyltransferase TsaD
MNLSLQLKFMGILTGMICLANHVRRKSRFAQNDIAVDFRHSVIAIVLTEASNYHKICRNP